MSLLRHVRKCNVYEAARFVPLLHESVQVRPRSARQCREIAAIPRCLPGRRRTVTLLAAGGFEPASAAIDAVVERLVGDGVIPKWRNEFFAVAPRWGTPPHFASTAAHPVLRTGAYGVHVNGWRRDGNR